MEAIISKIHEFSDEANRRELFLKDTLIHKSLIVFISKLSFYQNSIGRITYDIGKRKRIYQNRHFVKDMRKLLDKLITELKWVLNNINKDIVKMNEEKADYTIPIRHPYEISYMVEREFVTNVIDTITELLKK